MIQKIMPDFPLDADQVTNVIYVLVAYILGTGLEDTRAHVVRAPGRLTRPSLAPLSPPPATPAWRGAISLPSRASPARQLIQVTPWPTPSPNSSPNSRPSCSTTAPIFSTATCTATIRHALSQLNLRVPIQGGTLIDTVDGPVRVRAHVGARRRRTPDHHRRSGCRTPPATPTTRPSSSRRTREDERFFFRLAEPQAADGHLIVRFTQNNTIYGLDSATESTLTAEADVVLLDGAAAQSCRTAAVGKVLANNLDPNVPANYLKAATHFAKAFDNGLLALSRRRRLQVSVPSASAWNDAWHNWPSTLH